MIKRAPTLHELRAGLHVAGLIDAHGNSVQSARDAYQHASTGAQHPVENLMIGERLLVAAGFLVEHDDELLPTSAMMVLVSLTREEGLAALAAAFGLHTLGSGLGSHELDIDHDAEQLRAAYGAAGEEAVVFACREQLAGLGREDLVQGVQRVSLISDVLGYDVAAPALGGNLRLLEVKTESSGTTEARFYLSRNEYEVGRSRPGWALVYCRAPDGPDGHVDVVGWCRASALREFLPEDHRGRWTEARVRLPLRVLLPGIPPAV